MKICGCRRQINEICGQERQRRDNHKDEKQMARIREDPPPNRQEKYVMKYATTQEDEINTSSLEAHSYNNI